MPRDAAGTYTLPEAPFQPNTVAQSAKVNSNFTDIAAALTNSLSVSVAQPMQGDLNLNGHTITNQSGPLSVSGNLTASGLSVGTNTTGFPTMTLNGAAGTTRQFLGETAGKNRWVVVMGDAAPETGSNAGSNFAVARYADDGATSLGAPLSISRASGQVTINGNLAAASVNVTGGLAADNLNASGAGSVGGNFAVSGTGYIGTLNVSGNGSIGGTLSVAGAGVFYSGVGSGANGIAFAWNGTRLDAYVDRTWVGRVFLDTSAPP